MFSQNRSVSRVRSRSGSACSSGRTVFEVVGTPRLRRHGTHGKGVEGVLPSQCTMLEQALAPHAACGAGATRLTPVASGYGTPWQNAAKKR
ncbi:MAG: hypothetical protein QOH27_4216 [Mycobacterium sp.]|nr:hypothetical protein [Mycobacterium sp.]